MEYLELPMQENLSSRDTKLAAFIDLTHSISPWLEPIYKFMVDGAQNENDHFSSY